MQSSLEARVAADPNYQALKEKRSRFGWTLTLAMMVVYYGFILLIAFSKDVLAVRIGDGVMTWGIPIGFGVIVFTCVQTPLFCGAPIGWRVRRCLKEFKVYCNAGDLLFFDLELRPLRTS